MLCNKILTLNHMNSHVPQGCPRKGALLAKQAEVRVPPLGTIMRKTTLTQIRNTCEKPSVHNDRKTPMFPSSQTEDLGQGTCHRRRGGRTAPAADIFVALSNTVTLHPALIRAWAVAKPQTLPPTTSTSKCVLEGRPMSPELCSLDMQQQKCLLISFRYWNSGYIPLPCEPIWAAQAASTTRLKAVQAGTQAKFVTSKSSL
jgi:hypothetical protein